MDILAIQPSTITVDIKHPATGEAIGLKLEFTSLEDDRVKAVERQIRNKALRGGRNTITAEKIEENTTAILSAALVGWTWADGLTLGDMKNPPLNPANAAKLLSVPWIAKQADMALGDEAAFFQGSASR